MTVNPLVYVQSARKTRIKERQNEVLLMEETIIIQTKSQTQQQTFISALSYALIFGALLVSLQILMNGFQAVVGIFLVGVLVSFIFFVIIGLLLNQCELTITDKRAYGKAAFGKRVDLPLDSISAVATGVFKRFTIATPSGRITFWGIQNLNEFHSVVSQLLIKRQNHPVEIKQEIPQSNADELKKYKDLLDNGVITPEEFEAKKKQLLGL